MIIRRAFIVPVLALLLISACDSDEPESSNAVPLAYPNSEKTELMPVSEEKADEAFMADLSATLNLSFKIIHAMGKKDYGYLESIAAPDVTVSKEENKVYFEQGGEQFSWDFLQPVTLDKLEYRFSTYINEGNEFLAGFAVYSGDSHSTVEIYFIKEGGTWLFNGFFTNA